MMLEPAMHDLLKQVPSRYMLVNVVAHRARKIAGQAEEEGYPLNEKPVTLALIEVAHGEVEPSRKRPNKKASGGPRPDRLPFAG